jgi:hypothetical protein
MEDELFNVYFPKRPVCRFLSSESREDLMLTVSRESPQHKIIGFILVTPDLIDEMKHVQKLNKAIIKITPQRLNTLRDVSTLIALVINVIILYYYRYDQVAQADGSVVVEPVIEYWADLTIFILGAI